MKIAVDAMGGDHGPGVIVRGAIAGARQAGVGIVLVGKRDVIEAQLPTVRGNGVPIEILEAEDEIGMDEHPAMAVRRKPKASINIAMMAVKRGDAAGMVSAGNSGAVMTSALMTLGRIPGIDRPAIASVIPTKRGQTVLLDLGAVTNPTAQNLVDFARMAHVYARSVLGVASPAIGLLSNGEEPTKGNQLVQDVHPLLAAATDLRFIGNVEGKDLLRGQAEIIVADGFSGNIALKSMEGTAAVLFELVREEVGRGLHRKLAALVLRSAFRAVRSRLDYERFGGAPLLGVAGVAVIAHGRSSERAIANAVEVAAKTSQAGIVEALEGLFAPSEQAPI